MESNCKDTDNKEIYTTKKPRFQVPLTSITKVIQILKMLLNMPEIPMPGLNKYLITVGSKFRSGMSSTDLAARIMNRKTEAGIPTETLPSGAPNIDLKMERIRAEEIIRELTTKGKITVSFPTSAIKFEGSGYGYVTGTNTDEAKGEGVIS
tara:strand:+ start:942 stop:1394 length:453 start_codon:yes stop_codon:yes gene_type:complete